MFVNRIATCCALVALLQCFDAPGAVTIAGGLGKEGQARAFLNGGDEIYRVAFRCEDL